MAKWQKQKADDELLESWNMALSYFRRIDNLLTFCTAFQMQNDGLNWYKSLYRLYIELEAKMDDEQKAFAEKSIIEMTRWKNLALKNSKQNVPTEIFVKFELFLRNILEERTMLTPKQEDTRGL